MNQQYLNTYYNPEWVLDGIKEYFEVHEFFSEDMTDKYSESLLWSFLDHRMLSNLLYLRDERDNSITINNWKWGGDFSQRGYRENTSKIVKKRTDKDILYNSAHMRGAGVDFNEKGYSAEETRNWIEENADEMPYACRLEWKMKGKPISWVHMDTAYSPKNPKVYKFNV